MKRTLKTTLIATAALAAGAAGPAAPKQVVTGPVATYWMSAQTTSGFGMGAMGPAGPAAPGGGMGAMLGAMMGGRGGPAANWSHGLILQLGSARRPAGEPSAEHLPPPGLGAGPSLPLVTPKAQRAPDHPVDETPKMPREYQKPRGRMLIFWGCGEAARPGQPMVIDFASLAEGKAPPQAYLNLMRGLNIDPMRPPSPDRFATYGEWPNERTRTTVPPSGSLAGDHVIRGNYSPEIRISMTGAQDFLPAFEMTSNSRLPSGATQLAWRPVTGAQGYIASTMGGDGETVVFWSSSEVASLLFALPDYLRPSDVTRLVAQRGLMAPSTTSCAVPRAVSAAAPQSMYSLVAYGGEANFTYPARPADPKVAWNIDWTVKVRYRSSTGGLLGTPMPGMGGFGGFGP